MTGFNGLGMNLGNLSRLSKAETRSISAENYRGEKGKGAMATEGTGADAARDLGQGWKVSPCVSLKPGETLEVADIDGPGALQQIWMTTGSPLRYVILRIYWDGQEQPSVECPLGDFFANVWGGEFAQVSSLPVCVNPRNGMNCFWEMPFRKHCRITVSNIGEAEHPLFYQVNYTLTEVPEDCAYFHAQFRRANPLAYKTDYTILDGVKGWGQFVGVAMAWGANNIGWWGEGEIKFYLDGDSDYPTVCGTGTEDYFLGAWCFNVGQEYREYTTPFAGMPQVIRPDGAYQSQTRFGLYRWHIMDPIRFQHDLRITMQALGWRSGGRYLPLQDDIASTAFWYQTLPTAPFPELPDKDGLEIV